MPKTARDYLKHLAYFQNITSHTLEQLAASLISKQYEANESIFFEGEEALGLYLIEQGSVKIYKLSHSGNEQILHILGANNSFNDIAALDGGANPANATALSKVKLWFLPKQAFQTAMQEDTQLAIQVNRILASRVRKLVQQIEDLTLYSVVSRLSRFLIHQTQDPSLSGQGVTRTAIAAYLNTTPQTISNALNSIAEAGAIEFDRHRIIIIDEIALRQIAELE